MNGLFAAVPDTLPDFLAAAGLVLLGITFFREQIRYRSEERRLQNTIHELSSMEERKKDTVQRVDEKGDKALSERGGKL